MTVVEEKRLRGTNNNNTTQRACWLVLFSSPEASALGPPRGLSASLPPSATHPADRPLLQFATENTGERELGTKDVNKQTAEPADETHTQGPGPGSAASWVSIGPAGPVHHHMGVATSSPLEKNALDRGEARQSGRRDAERLPRDRLVPLAIFTAGHCASTVTPSRT